VLPKAQAADLLAKGAGRAPRRKKKRRRSSRVGQESQGEHRRSREDAGGSRRARPWGPRRRVGRSSGSRLPRRSKRAKSQAVSSRSWQPGARPPRPVSEEVGEDGRPRPARKNIRISLTGLAWVVRRQSLGLVAERPRVYEQAVPVRAARTRSVGAHSARRSDSSILPSPFSSPTWPVVV